MALEVGTRLGHYEVLSSLGAGGMGEVYRAKDTKLGREVAVKLLLDEVSSDPERLARFEREARVLASLNHKNIASLHAFEREGDTGFLVMELVEGETLADRIAHGPIPVEEAIPLFLQIAEGLEAAHEKGVIHRDLKPANIKVTDDGNVKILDFGLAKAMAPATGPESDPSESPTLTQAATLRGQILGTAAYMSPEQAKGKEVDRRADVWAFGVCLYEALTGSRAFRGDDAADTLAAVLRAEIDWGKLPPATPRAIRRLLRRCLTKDPRERLHDIADVRIEIRGVLEQPDIDAPAGGEAAPARRQVSAVLAGALALLTLAAGLVLGFVLDRGGEEDAASDAASADTWTVTALDLEAAPGLPFVLSPDGRMVVFIRREGAETSLYRRSLDSLVAERISGSDGAVFPIFSPDGQQLAFRDGGGSLKTLPVEGGGASALVDGLPNVWGRDGFLYYTLGQGFTTSLELWRIPAGGGVPEQVGHGTGGALLPGERVALANLRSERPDGFWSDVRAVDLETGEERVLLPGAEPFYLDPGFLVFYRESGLWAAPIDPETAALLGPARQVENGVAPVLVAGVDIGSFSLADSGDLLYVLGSHSLPRLVWVSRNGLDIEELAPDRKSFGFLNPSLDWRRIAVSARNDRGNYEQWMLDLETGSWTRPTQEGNRNTGAMWVPPDGQEIVFMSDRFEGRFQIYIQPADRGAPAERLVPSEHEQAPLDFSPDGRYLLYTNLDVPGLWVFDRESGESETLLEGNLVHAARFHPTGRWITYSMVVQGEENVWIRPFPGAGEPRQLTSDGGQEPDFSPEGSEILYRSPTHMMTLPIEISGEDLVTRRPEPLFEDDYLRLGGRFQNYAVHPDGRFLMIQAAEAEEERLVLVQNWRAKVLEMFSEGGS